MQPWEPGNRPYVTFANTLNLYRGRHDRRKNPEDTMNWSIYTADRTTHLKIVVVGLVAALLVSVIGVSAGSLNLGTDIMSAQAPTVIKAGGPVSYTDRNRSVIR